MAGRTGPGAGTELEWGDRRPLQLEICDRGSGALRVGAAVCCPESG